MADQTTTPSTDTNTTPFFLQPIPGTILSIVILGAIFFAASWAWTKGKKSAA